MNISSPKRLRSRADQLRPEQINFRPVSLPPSPKSLLTQSRLLYLHLENFPRTKCRIPRRKSLISPFSTSKLSRNVQLQLSAVGLHFRPVFPTYNAFSIYFFRSEFHRAPGKTQNSFPSRTARKTLALRAAHHTSPCRTHRPHFATTGANKLQIIHCAVFPFESESRCKNRLRL